MRDRLERTKDTVEIVAVIGAAVWALWTFGFREYWIPDHRAPVVAIQGHIGVPPRAGDRVIVDLEATIKNEGDRRLYVLGYWYNVFGSTIDKAQEDEFKARAEKLTTPAFLSRRPAFRSFSVGPRTTEATGRFVGDGWWLEPGESMAFREAIVISNAHDLVAIDLYARIAAKPNRVRTEWKFGKYGLEQECQILDGRVWRSFDKNSPRLSELRNDYGLSLSYSSAVVALAPSGPPHVTELAQHPAPETLRQVNRRKRSKH